MRSITAWGCTLFAFSRFIFDVQYYVRSSLRRNGVAAMMFVMLQLGDVISTHVGLQAGLREANPLASRLFAATGGGTYSLKLTAMMAFLVLVCLLEPRYPRIWRAVRVTNVIMLFVVLLNTLQLFW